MVFYSYVNVKRKLGYFFCEKIGLIFCESLVIKIIIMLNDRCILSYFVWCIDMWLNNNCIIV